MNFERIYNQVAIKTRMKVNRSLLVGSGAGDISPSGVDMPQIRMSILDGEQPVEVPYIPGSSLKGAVRSVCELLVRTYVDNYKGMKILCYDNTPEEKTECGKGGKPMCMMCDTFGNTNRASKVAFDDAFLSERSERSLVETIQHRSSTSIDRHTGTVAGKALFRMEFVPKGTEFEFNTLCTNILPSELKLVLLAMALYNEGRFKMGGQKSRGMGSVEFDIDTVTLYLPKLYGTDPFLEVDGEYYWISADDLAVPSLEVIYVPREGWASQDEEVWRVRLTQLAQRLYPIAGEGNIAIKVRVQDAEPQVIDIGSFALSMVGEKVEASVKPTMNGLEYEIRASKLGRGLLGEVYRSAFDFLSNIEQNKADQEVFGRASFPLPDGRGKMVTFTVAEESRKLHDLLVWLKLAKLLIG